MEDDVSLCSPLTRENTSERDEPQFIVHISVSFRKIDNGGQNDTS